MVQQTTYTLSAADFEVGLIFLTRAGYCCQPVNFLSLAFVETIEVYDAPDDPENSLSLR